ncbi:MAG: type II secretion system F family protein [Alphaproteobacteria bacterium]|nr:type II secretion system F family protein [Alphaproteobacteria bacterium]MCL2505717.1 type II secretion system F family protein [Alphaproteobacteria bacterium]
MPMFKYRAVDKDGKIWNDVISIGDSNELRYHISSLGLQLIEASEISKKAQYGREFFVRKISLKSILYFCSMMRQLLASGIDFVNALKLVQVNDKRFSNILVQVSAYINSGRGISESFSTFDHVLPSVFLSMLKIGERSSNITKAFEQLEVLLRAQINARDKILKASVYPSFMLIVLLVVMSYMTVYLLPVITDFIYDIVPSSSEENLPVMTHVLLHVSKFLSAYGGLILLLITALIFCTAVLSKTSLQFRILRDKYILKIPLIGKVLLKTEIAKLAKSMQILLEYKTDILVILEELKNTAGNNFIKDKLNSAEAMIENGHNISDALSEIFPNDAVALLVIGEKSGFIIKSLDTISERYNTQVEFMLDNLTSVIKPCFIIMSALFLLLIVFAFIAPIYSMSNLMNL